MSLRVSEITLSKGGYSVTIYATSVDEEFTNKLFPITPPTGTQNQDGGKKAVKIIDLLRITRKIVIKGHILNNTDKASLISIMNGGGMKGGSMTLSYPDGADAVSFNVFIDNFKINQKATDEPDSPPNDYAKYDLDITFIEGISIGGT